MRTTASRRASSTPRKARHGGRRSCELGTYDTKVPAVCAAGTGPIITRRTIPREVWHTRRRTRFVRCAGGPNPSGRPGQLATGILNRRRSVGALDDLVDDKQVVGLRPLRLCVTHVEIGHE